jgi:hypothetical protein
MDRKPSAGLLVLVCTETGGEIPTGVEYTQAELARSSRVTVHEQCPFCDRGHVFGFAEARVIPRPCRPLAAEKSSHETPAKAKRVRAGENR